LDRKNPGKRDFVVGLVFFVLFFFHFALSQLHHLIFSSPRPIHTVNTQP
jgi:hypothetical protein